MRAYILTYVQMRLAGCNYEKVFSSYLPIRLSANGERRTKMCSFFLGKVGWGNFEFTLFQIFSLIECITCS